jgi:NADH-quinone oxidoreductase subunit M
MNVFHDFLLPLLILIPLGGAAVVGLAPLRDPKALFRVALVIALLEGALSIGVFALFDPTIPYAQLVWSHDWFSLPGAGAPIPVRAHLGVDGISILLVSLTGWLAPVVLLSAMGHIQDRTREFLVWMLVMFAGLQGVFLARDLLLFYVFWEVSLVRV